MISMNRLELLLSRRERNQPQSEMALPPDCTLLNSTSGTRTIATELTDDNLRKCLPQDQSPLFAKLPAELRNMIFDYATAPCTSDQDSYSTRHFCYRPGHSGRHIYHTTLLLTCRRIWLETNSLPLLQAEHCFWFNDVKRRPNWCVRSHPSEIDRLKSLLERLTPLGMDRLHHLHLFTQMFFLDESIRSESMDDVLRLFEAMRKQDVRTGEWFMEWVAPRVFTLTIRHFDWWGWENGQQLHLTLGSFMRMINKLEAVGVETFCLELETLAPKVPQLEPIMRDLRQLQPPCLNLDGTIRSIEEATAPHLRLQEGHREDVWYGPADGPWPNCAQYAGMERLEYHVFTLTWKRDRSVAQTALRADDDMQARLWSARSLWHG